MTHKIITTISPELEAYRNDPRHKKKKRSHAHDDHCMEYFRWCCLNYKLQGNVIHIPNEGKRSPQQGERLVNMGLSKGFPDYMILVCNSKHWGLFLEMKLPKERTSTMRKEQVDWLNKLNRKGYYAAFAFGYSHAITITEDYLENRI